MGEFIKNLLIICGIVFLLFGVIELFEVASDGKNQQAAEEYLDVFSRVASVIFDSDIMTFLVGFTLLAAVPTLLRIAKGIIRS